MKLKNTLIVVKDIEKSKKFYCEMLGLVKVLENDGNLILSSGLVLQQADIWEKAIGKNVTWYNNCCEMYFEERNLDCFCERLKEKYPDVEIVSEIKANDWDRKVIRFYDPDGNLIEVAQV